MANDGRCSCGCRIFFSRQIAITTASGSIRDIPSMMILECIRCLRVYSTSTDPGKKTLQEWGVGEEGERMLFSAALKDWMNRDRPQDNANFLILEEADEKDFDRLGIPKPESVKQ